MSLEHKISRCRTSGRVLTTLQAGELFNLDLERKLEFVNVVDGSPQRGYSAIGVEKTASLHSQLVGRSVDEKLTDARVSLLYIATISHVRIR